MNEDKESKFARRVKVSQEMLREMVANANLPNDMKQEIISNLPALAESLDDAMRKIYDPSRIWLESAQYADYVDQLADHLFESAEDDHGPECLMEIANGLQAMSQVWKSMAENAMTLLDEMNVEAEMYDFETVIIGMREDNGPQS